MQQYIAIDQGNPPIAKFNKVTEKAIKQVLAGKNLKHFKNINDLIEDLEN